MRGGWVGRYGVGEVEEEEERSVGMCVRVGRWVGISRFCPRKDAGCGSEDWTQDG